MQRRRDSSKEGKKEKKQSRKWKEIADADYSHDVEDLLTEFIDREKKDEEEEDDDAKGESFTFRDEKYQGRVESQVIGVAYQTKMPWQNDNVREM